MHMYLHTRAPAFSASQDTPSLVLTTLGHPPQVTGVEMLGLIEIRMKVSLLLRLWLYYSTLCFNDGETH